MKNDNTNNQEEDDENEFILSNADNANEAVKSKPYAGISDSAEMEMNPEMVGMSLIGIPSERVEDGEKMADFDDDDDKADSVGKEQHPPIVRQLQEAGGATEHILAKEGSGTGAVDIIESSGEGSVEVADNVKSQQSLPVSNIAAEDISDLLQKADDNAAVQSDDKEAEKDDKKDHPYTYTIFIDLNKRK